MGKSFKVELGRTGDIRMLWDDDMNLAPFGKVEVKRVSNVEFDSTKQAWYVQSAKTGRILRSDFKTRVEALAWEKGYYSPGGLGWEEAKSL